ncbi:MAG TPA: hypothetical protein VGV09_11250 [Steroidobacteraceae bacterium]|nr:hypothetical protein [Steroidobacteraceae bacterium]
MRAHTTPVIATLLLAVSATRCLAGAFDGNWAAMLPPQDSCNGTSIMTLTMSDNSFQGQTRNFGNTEAFSGKIEADGSGTMVIYPHSSGTIKFAGDHFEANWNERACRRHAMGDRALSSTEAAAAYAQRRQFQARFADLTRRAAQGELAVDFTVLRSAYPYTDQWDPYGNKTTALLDQAAAAATGKDCVSALEKLDEILKLDFTIDAAHALRSDCLAASGREPASRIESNIADGLIHSLMDSGDGNTEASAYVIMTEREERDVLANRHLVVKLRQTQVRGVNGHFYDVVQGTSATDGALVKTVYFDVSSLVNGRKSRMAAIDTLASSMP